MELVPKPKRILIPDVPIGGKAYLIRTKGMYVLEEGPGMLQTVNITHSGSGELHIYDGVPDPNGFFPDGAVEDTDPKYGLANGRCFEQFSPTYMGAWMSNAGFRHGLTVLVSGDVSPFATFVWQAVKTQLKSRLPVEKPQPERATSLKVTDIKTPAVSHSLMRTVRLAHIGVFRLARRSAEFYSIMIDHSGSFCRLIVRNGKGVPLFDQFSSFTGSFVNQAYAEGGIVVDVEGKQQAPLLSVNWREPDLQLI
jgi:hypothetical protein